MYKSRMYPYRDVCGTGRFFRVKKVRVVGQEKGIFSTRSRVFSRIFLHLPET